MTATTLSFHFMEHEGSELLAPCSGGQSLVDGDDCQPASRGRFVEGFAVAVLINKMKDTSVNDTRAAKCEEEIVKLPVNIAYLEVAKRCTIQFFVSGESFCRNEIRRSGSSGCELRHYRYVSIINMAEENSLQFTSNIAMAKYDNDASLYEYMFKVKNRGF